MGRNNYPLLILEESFETTNISVSFAEHTPPQKLFGIFPFGETGVGHGLVTFGVRSEGVSLHDAGHKDSQPRTSLSNIDFNIYFNKARKTTPGHEMEHVRYITGQFLKNGTIKNASYQHQFIIGTSRVPTIQQLIQLKNN